MRQILFFLIIILGVIYFFDYSKKQEVLPVDAIRFRVIANSDSEYDQEVKKLVGKEIQKQISMKLKGITNSEEARKILKNNVPVFQDSVSKTLALNNIDEDFYVNYGMNYFPEKTYNGVTYDAGKYESLVITLGEGLGKNWWCVLFPPLCLLEAEEEEDTTDIEYSFFIWDLMDKYFN